MSDKEVNQLKRGRVSGKSRKPKKVSTVGEISDPTSVLNDSISQGHSNQGTSEAIQKSTTVDAPLVSDIQVHKENQEQKPNKRQENRNNAGETRNHIRQRKEKISSKFKPYHEEHSKCPCKKWLCQIKQWLCKVADFFGFKCKKCCSSSNHAEQLSTNKAPKSNRRHGTNTHRTKTRK